MATINFLDFIDGQLFRVIMDNHFKSQVHKNQRNMKISGFNDRRFYQCTQNIFLITHNSNFTGTAMFSFWNCCTIQSSEKIDGQTEIEEKSDGNSEMLTPPPLL